MASNVRTVSNLGMINQSGNGIPSHEVKGKASFIDLDTGISYINLTGKSTDWKNVSVSSHNEISGRDELDCHPASAISYANGSIDEYIVTTIDRVSDVTVGSIDKYDTIPSGKTVDDLVDMIFTKVYYPVYVVPTASLNVTPSSSLEAGQILDLTATLTYNRGSITVDGAFQNYRGGAATQYTLESVTGLTNSRIIQNYPLIEGNNIITSNVLYSIGAQPLDSKGNPVDSPFPAGSFSPTYTVVSRRYAFFGSDSTSNSAYTTSFQIRSLVGKHTAPANGTSFTINVPIGAKMVCFSYKATLQNVTTVKYVEGSNAEIKGNFLLSNVNVEGANGYTPVAYKLYTMIPDAPFTTTATYVVTI